MGDHKGRPYHTRRFRIPTKYSRGDPCGRPLEMVICGRPLEMVICGRPLEMLLWPSLGLCKKRSSVSIHLHIYLMRDPVIQRNYICQN